MDYVRTLPEGELAIVVLTKGHKKAAEWFGISPSSLNVILRERQLADQPMKPELSAEQLTAYLTQFGSVRLVARLLRTTEAWIRSEATRQDVDARLLIDYSTGNNSNAKGRRAEQDYAALRGPLALNDLNLTVGSQADYDFDDAELLRVNVKSSRRYQHKAKTRRNNPYFFKFSTNGCEKCDHLVLMCYDEDMKVLLGVAIVAAPEKAATRTIAVYLDQISPPEGPWNTISHKALETLPTT